LREVDADLLIIAGTPHTQRAVHSYTGIDRVVDSLRDSATLLDGLAISTVVKIYNYWHEPYGLRRITVPDGVSGGTGSELFSTITFTPMPSSLVRTA
jgi:hypothetical protein